MRRRLSMNLGFVTNSSSMIHHFPKEVLDHPKVRTFMRVFEIEDGFVGQDLWHRGACTTVAVTKEQKKQVQASFTNNEGAFEERGPKISVDSDEVVVIYGDESSSVACSLACLMCEVLAEMKGGDPWDYRHAVEYN